MMVSGHSLDSARAVKQNILTIEENDRVPAILHAYVQYADGGQIMYNYNTQGRRRRATTQKGRL
jgi:hypothetical protein